MDASCHAPITAGADPANLSAGNRQYRGNIAAISRGGALNNPGTDADAIPEPG
jgi:hypothetical protein